MTSEAIVVKGCKRLFIRTAFRLVKTSDLTTLRRVSDHTRFKEALQLSRLESDNLEFKIGKTTDTISLTIQDQSVTTLRRVREK